MGDQEFRGEDQVAGAGALLDFAVDLRVTGRTGALLPAHATAEGKALLAAMKPAEVRALFSSGLTRMTDQTNTNMKTLLEELGDVARQGYALNLGESLDGLHAAAVCVSKPAGKVVASLAVAPRPAGAVLPNCGSTPQRRKTPHR